MTDDYNVDSSDVNFVLLAFNPTTPLGVGLWLIAIGIVLMFAASNASDCSKRHCETGVPRVIDHNCICVEKATP